MTADEIMDCFRKFRRQNYEAILTVARWALGKGLGRLRYWAFLQTPAWKALRRQVMNRDFGRCQCGREAFEVHHTSYAEGWMAPMRLLVSLCRRCHDRAHKRQACTA